MPVRKATSLSITHGDFWLREGSGLPKFTSGSRSQVSWLAAGRSAHLVRSAIQLSATTGWVRKCVCNHISQTLSILGQRTE